MSKNCAAILAAGQGKRMKTTLPKPLLKVLGKPMIDWVINSCKNSEIENIVVVTGYNKEAIENHLGDSVSYAEQKERLGTGHAVMQCTDYLSKFKGGNVLILYGDAPFVNENIIKDSLDFHIKSGNSVTVVSGIISEPFGYGRILRENGVLKQIIEEKDCTAEQKKITEVNSGVYWFNVDALLEALSELTTNNSQGEYYLTDTISILLSHGKKADAFVSDDKYFIYSANDRKGMLELNTIARLSIIEKHLNNGVCFNCTDGIIIESDVIIGCGTEILQGTILKSGTVIGENCIIGPNCLLENTIVGNNTTLNYVQSYSSEIKDNVKIGPFVHIRPGSVINSGVKIGDFVEVKNSTIGENTAIAHLTYVGDSDVGKHVNFGCGVVTVNYDGEKKYRTTIGDEAFIGCNTNLIAPVKIGNGAYTAAGTTVTKDVPDNALALDRGEFKLKEGYAEKKLRNRKKN